MQNYYLEVLELTPGATKADVKKAYRRLSKRYHPDLNKSEDAKDKFIQITEAYDFLTKVGPTPHNEPIRYDYDPFESEYEQWRKRARSKAKKKAHDRIKMQQEAMRKTLAFFRFAAYAILIFNILITFDYLMPTASRVDVVKEKEHYAKYIKRIYFSESVMLLDRNAAQHIEEWQKVTLSSTRIFNVPQSVSFYRGDEQYQASSVYGFYSIYGWITPLMFIMVFFYRYVFEYLEQKMTLAIFAAFLTFIQLAMLFG